METVMPMTWAAMLGTFLGGVLRFMPEIFKLIHKKMDYVHEKEMITLSSELSKQAHEDRLDICETASDMSKRDIDSGFVDKIMQVLGTPSGSPIIDKINASIRATVILTLLGLYAVHKLVFLYYVVTHNSTLLSFTVVWSADDMAFLTGTASFFYLGRVFGK